jgi:eukaryotic-like serine/threonine-protein kinase
VTARPQLEPGLQLAGRYHLRVLLGSGGAGTVWRADDDVLDRPVAVKLLHPELERDSSAVARFRREATSAAALTHPNAVIVYDIGEESGRIFLVMELVDGPTLSDMLRERPLPATEVAALGGAVSRALGAAHDRDLVHRDVKPGNVLLTREGVAKMADFGIATALGDAQARLTTPGMVVGTSTYLAPEQLSGEAIDGRADIYSLGLVLYECLTGEAAFSGGTAVEVATRRLTGDVPPPSTRVAGVPEELDLIVQRATRRDPAERWEHGADLAAALLSLAPDDAARRLASLIEARVGPAQVSVAPHSPASRAPDEPVPAAARRDEEAPTSVVDERAAAAPDRGPTSDSSSTTAIPAAAAAGGAGSAAGAGGAGDATGADGGAGWSSAGERTGTIPAQWADEPDGGAEGPVEQRSAGRRWRPVLLGLAILALAGFALLGVLGGDEVLESSPAGPGGNDDGDTDEPAVFEPADASDFDPFGGGEHPGDIPNAFDGDPDTTWQTQRYNSAAFGNLKPGVGLYLDLGEPAAVRELQLSLSPEGADLEVYAADDVPSASGSFDPAEWGEQAASVEGAGTDTVIELDEAMEEQVWLIWFTSLPADGGGHRVSLSEITFQG